MIVLSGRHVLSAEKDILLKGEILMGVANGKEDAHSDSHLNNKNQKISVSNKKNIHEKTPFLIPHFIAYNYIQLLWS
jgi:hypothetical protein